MEVPVAARPMPGSGPLWVRVEADLRARIDEGEFQAAFPGEHALTAEYGVSRHTVREALRRIRRDGLVTAARGRAPRLAPDGVLHQPLGALYSLFRSVEDSGRTQRSHVRALDVRLDEAVATRLSLPADTALTYLERLRLANDEPLALDQVWLPAGPTSALLETDFSHTALYDELRARCAIVVSGGVEAIRAVLVDESEAGVLDLVTPAPAFLIERTGHVAGAPFEFRRTLVRSDGFALTAEYSSQDGYQLTQGRGQNG